MTPLDELWMEYEATTKEIARDLALQALEAGMKPRLPQRDSGKARIRAAILPGRWWTAEEVAASAGLSVHTVRGYLQALALGGLVLRRRATKGEHPGVGAPPTYYGVPVQPEGDSR